MKAPGQDGAAEEKAASGEEVEKTKTLPFCELLDEGNPQRLHMLSVEGKPLKKCSNMNL